MASSRFRATSLNAQSGPPQRASARRGFSLIELLCVLAIISILASLLLTAVSRAYRRVKRFGGEMNAPAYIDQIRSRTLVYFEHTTSYPELGRDEFIRRCGIGSQAAAFLRSAEVVYVPFSSASPDDQLVIIQQVGQGRDQTFNGYSKGWLSHPDPP